MSSFDGIDFSVVAEDDNWYPLPELDNDGIARYKCRAWIPNGGARRQLARRVNVVTALRPLGATGAVVYTDASPGGVATRGDFALRVPETAGERHTHRAVLVGMTGVTSYGRYVGRGYMADLEFIIVSDPWEGG